MSEVERTKLVVGEKLTKLENANICLLGVGGVGGYVLEMLYRLGVKNITIVDCDNFEKSNLNRQLYATYSSIDKPKVDIAKQRAKEINSNCVVQAIKEKICEETLPNILGDKNFDFVIDCIDDVQAKIATILFCNKQNINLVCAMGTGNRYKMPRFEIMDLFKTSYDGLARKMRNELKKRNFRDKVDVCCTLEMAEKTSALGSVVYYPLMCAGALVSYVANKIMGK